MRTGGARRTGLTVAAVAALSLVMLAGCGGKAGNTPRVLTDEPLANGKGAISGLVIDDRYRPVPDATVLLTPLGYTATSDSEGQFSFRDLSPGAYVLLVNAKDHEAAPKNVDVGPGVYSEVELEARRTFSEGSYLVTTEYSVFISCAVDYIANGFVYDCTADQSHDSDRPGFYSDYTGHGKNVTYLVAEMLANHHDRYEVQVRCENTGAYYAVSRIDGVYSKMTMSYKNATTDSPVPPEYGPTVKWDNKCKQMHTILFSDSQGREELQGAGVPVCCGVGVHLGIKAKFVQSLFIGAPQTPIATYGVLKPAA
ncbi:MAG: carboxypeptidase-like regulatory domain-containing protein [bacterium]